MNNQQQTENEVKPEGELTIQSKKESKKKMDKDIGEYTDFEDIN